MQERLKGAPGPRPAALSLLPETASLSPTAAKTVKHHTASMMFTFSPGLQHRQPQNVTNSADGEERKKPKGRNDGEDVGRICYTSDDARPLIALAASQLLSADTTGIFTPDCLKSIIPIVLWRRSSIQACRFIIKEMEIVERASRIHGSGAAAYGSIDEEGCVCVCVYARICGMRKQNDGKCAGSAVRRTRGAVGPSLIPCTLPLPLPCSSVQRNDATVYVHK